jgi:hypothetical protein
VANVGASISRTAVTSTRSRASTTLLPVAPRIRESAPPGMLSAGMMVSGLPITSQR